MKKIITQLLWLSFAILLTSKASSELSKPKLSALYSELSLSSQSITNRFENQKNQKLKELATYSALIKNKKLYHDLQNAFKVLEDDKTYKSYATLIETIELIGDLQTFNQNITESTLLEKTNKQLETLKGEESLSTVRSLLKKQRGALIELLDDKDFIISNAKSLQSQQQELINLITVQKAKLLETTPYKSIQILQKEYLALPEVDKINGCLEKLYTLTNQIEIALLKNKDHQKIIRSIKLFDPQIRQDDQILKVINSTRQELFLVPIEDIL